MPKYWLLKTEPESFSIQDLAKAPKKTTCWDGVRNYQARNYMRDEMKVGDGVLFYHSSADPTAIVGTAKVVKEGYPDPTAWDKTTTTSTRPHPPRILAGAWSIFSLGRSSNSPCRWSNCKVPALKRMELLRKGSRLSVQPVTKDEFETVLKLAKQ